jgi:restriction system protein
MARRSSVDYRAVQRQRELHELNEALAARNQALEGLLRGALEVDDFFEIQSLRVALEIPPFRPGALATPGYPPDQESFMPVAPAGAARFKLGASRKHARAVADATERYETAVAVYQDRERRREDALKGATVKYESEVANLTTIAEAENRDVDEFEASFGANNPDAIVRYFSMVLDRSVYPEGFLRTYRMAFVPESKQLVVELQLPSIDVVPKIKQYRYVKVRDAMEETARPQTQIKGLYASVVAQVTLRTMHELFEADRTGKLETVVLNGYVDTIDPATGRPYRRIWLPFGYRGRRSCSSTFVTSSRRRV